MEEAFLLKPVHFHLQKINRGYRKIKLKAKIGKSILARSTDCLESVQLDAARVCTGALPQSNCQKTLSEIDWETLQLVENGTNSFICTK